MCSFKAGLTPLEVTYDYCLQWDTISAHEKQYPIGKFGVGLLSGVDSMVEYLQTPVPCYRIAFLAKQEVEGSPDHSTGRPELISGRIPHPAPVVTCSAIPIAQWKSARLKIWRLGVRILLGVPGRAQHQFSARKVVLGFFFLTFITPRSKLRAF